MCPLALTATPVASPRYMSFGIFSGSDPSKGITGTSWANAEDASASDRATSSRFMTFSSRRIAAVRRDGLGGSIAAGSLERAALGG
jgi:hypothetical protein